MFKAIKNNKVIAINETGNFPCLVYDSIEQDAEHTVSDYVQIDNEFVLTSDNKAIEQKKAAVRAIRNQYLSETDKYMIVDYPITDEQREEYKAYRVYLRDYTKNDNWFELEPMKFDVWQAEQVKEETVSEEESDESEIEAETEQP